MTPEHLLFEPVEKPAPKPSPERPKTIWEAERDLILETLDRVGGNRTQAARILEISIRTLRNKLREYRQTGIQREAGGQEPGKKCPTLGKESLISSQDPAPTQP